MATILDKEKLKILLREADEKWFAAHGVEYKYEEHLGHTASFISRNYNRKRGKNGNRKSPVAREADGKRQGSRASKESPVKQKLFSMPKSRARRRAAV